MPLPANISQTLKSNFMYCLAYMFHHILALTYITKGHDNVSLDVAILGFLAERPSSGYDLKTRCFTGPVSAFWSADQAQIYRTLDRLNKDGLVNSVRRRSSGKPDRRIFEITPAGRDHLHALLGTAPSPPYRDAFLMQVYFSEQLTDGELVETLTARRASHQSLLDSLRQHSAELAEDKQLSARKAVLRQTAIEGAMARERALVDWLDDCLEAVGDGALPGSTDGVGQRHLFGS